MTTSGSVDVKLWIKLQGRDDDSAIKMMLPPTSDISDVLVACPTFFNVPCKASDLQLFLKGNKLSNLSSIADIGMVSGDILVLSISSNAMMIPANIVEALSVPLPSKTVPNVKKGGPPSSSSTTNKIREISPKRGATPSTYPAPVAKPTTVTIRKSAPCTSLRASSTERPPLPSSSIPRATSAHRPTTSAPKRCENSLPVASHPTSSKVVPSLTNRTSSVKRETFTKSNSMSNLSNPLSRSAAPMVHSTTTNNKAPLVRSTVSKVSITTAHWKRTISSSTTTVSAAPEKKEEPVCPSFKPVWGQNICFTCKHSKAAHLMAAKAKSKSQEQQQHVDPTKDMLQTKQLNSDGGTSPPSPKRPATTTSTSPPVATRLHESSTSTTTGHHTPKRASSEEGLHHRSKPPLSTSPSKKKESSTLATELESLGAPLEEPLLMPTRDANQSFDLMPIDHHQKKENGSPHSKK